MRTFTKVHEKRIARLTKRLMCTKTYNQSCFYNPCGSPGCVIGHMKEEFGSLKWIFYKSFLFGVRPQASKASDVWDRDIFTVWGCGNANRSGKKAALFIRKMAKDLKAAQT
jgi:hypothetical protein